MSRRAITLVELLVVLAIITILMALAIPAIQRVRGTMDRVKCASNLHQLGLALHHYHNDHRRFPPGVTLPKAGEIYPRMTFLTRLLPYLEKDALYRQAGAAWELDPLPFNNATHPAFATTVGIFACPTDNRLNRAQPTHNGRTAALTSYVGVNGTDWTKKDGVFFADSAVSLDTIYDGASFTIMVGERPPSPDFWFGWWYATVGQNGSGAPDTLLGVRELNAGGTYTYFCPPGPAAFQAGRLNNQCDVFHYWSLHAVGGNFLMAGGNVHFLKYSADALLPALATRQGREKVELE